MKSSTLKKAHHGLGPATKDDCTSLKLSPPKSNIVLIGMPGAGKSTIGALFAKRHGLDFMDTDNLIAQRAGRSLQHIVDKEGYLRLRQLEEQCLCDITTQKTLISTGGSAVYSATAMAHLAEHGSIIYLHLPLEVIKERIGDHSERGLAKPANQTLDQLYQERDPLYRQHADQQLDCKGLTPETVCDLLAQVFK